MNSVVPNDDDALLRAAEALAWNDDAPAVSRGTAMIDPDAQPIDHRPPYKRVDLAARTKKRRPTKQQITREEIEDNREPMPDPEFYDQDFYGNWNLKA